MRIGGGGVSRDVGAVRLGGDVSSTNSRVVGGAFAKDVVSVSQAAQIAVAARDKLAEIPSVRTSKIEAIQSQLESGAYSPDGEAVAAGLMREYMQFSH